MKKILFALTALCGMYFNSSSQSITRLLALSSQDGDLRILDTNSYAVIDVKTLAYSNSTMSIDGCNGIAKHPVSGVYYMITKDANDRYLGVLDPATGSVSLTGALGDKFSQITFNGNNTLLGVTGDGANTPETVFNINISTAATTSLAALGNGADGEVITYNPTNNKIYHWSGNSTLVYEKFDTTFVTPTNISVPSYTGGEVFGAVYKTNGKFLASNISDDLMLVDTLGNFTSVNTFSTGLKGLAYISCPRQITGMSTFCANSSATLSMSGSGSATYQWYLNGLAVSNATNQAIVTNTAGYYKCVISDGCGTDSIANGVTTQQLALPVVSISGPTTVCSGQTITLTGSSGGTSQWYQNGVLIPGATNNTYQVSAAGLYNMIKTNTNGCKDSASVGKTVSVLTSPSVSVSASSTTLCVGQSVTLTATGASSYTWNTSATTNTISVSPTVTTTYSATGTGTVNACTKTTTISISVSPCTGISQNSKNTSSFELYPNPSTGLITIKSENEFTAYCIVDVTGKTVRKENVIGSTTLQLDLSELKGTIYFIQLYESSGYSKQAKIILNH